MKSLEEYNKERMRLWFNILQKNTNKPNGLECPKCGKELHDTNPGIVLTSQPPKIKIHCPSCGYTGFRII